MTFRTESARHWPCVAVALLLVAPTALFAAGLGEAPGDPPGGSQASQPSTDLLAGPLPLPAITPVRFTTGHGLFSPVHSVFDRETLSFAPVFGREGEASFRSDGFSVRLLSKMSREARRYRERNVSDSAGVLRNEPLGGSDSAAELTLSATASRVITRSSHRALSDEIERAARASLGLGPTLDLLQNLSLLGGGSRGRDGAPLPTGPARSAAGIPNDTPKLRGDVGVRLDAHPALLLRARFGTLRGRIDVPVRNEPVRFSLESTLGSRGRAVLSSGLPRDGQAWATLTFSFGF